MNQKQFISWALTNSGGVLVLLLAILHPTTFTVGILNVLITFLFVFAILVSGIIYAAGDNFIEFVGKQDKAIFSRNRTYLNIDRSFDMLYSMGLFIGGLYYGFVLYALHAMLNIYSTEKILAFIQSNPGVSEDASKSSR